MQTHFQESPPSGIVPFPWPWVLLQENKAVVSQPKPEWADGLAFWEHSRHIPPRIPQNEGPFQENKELGLDSRLRLIDQQKVPQSRLARVRLEKTAGFSWKWISLIHPPYWTQPKLPRRSAGQRPVQLWYLGAGLKCLRKWTGTRSSPIKQCCSKCSFAAFCSFSHVLSSSWEVLCLPPVEAPLFFAGLF